MNWTFSESFAGIGAWGKAINRVTKKHNDTCELKWYAEIDKYASNSFAAIHNVSEKLNIWDITKDTKVPEVDIFFYSPPCQTFSIAGARKLATVPKGNLFYNALDKIKQIKPKYLIMENVKGLVSGAAIEDFKYMFFELERNGYFNYYKVLNSKDYGIPQNRERVFIVSIRKDLYNQGKRFEFPQKIKLEKCLHDILQEKYDGKYLLSQKMINGLLHKDNNFQGSFIPKEVGDVGSCIDTKEGGRRTNNFIIIDDTMSENFGGIKYYKDYCPTLRSNRHGLKVAIGTSRGRDKNNVSDHTKGNKNLKQHLEINKLGLCNALTTVQKDNLVVEVNSATVDGYEEEAPGDSITLERPKSTTRRGRVGKQVSQTLTTSCNIGYYNGMNIRKLTPMECFRLQGFDDEDYYKAVESYDKTFTKGKSDTQMYMRAGNSITVNVIEELLENLLYDRKQIGNQLSMF